MKRKLTVGLMLLAIGCGGDTTENTQTNNSDGKSDGVGSKNRLKIGGSHVEEIAFGDATRCDIEDQLAIAEWRHPAQRPDDQTFSKLTVRLFPAARPTSGDVLDGTGSRNVLILGGYTSEEGPGCDILVDEFVGEGPDAGFAVSVDKCQMIFDSETISVTGSVFCLSDGSGTSNNENNTNNDGGNTCDAETYTEFVDELADLTQVRNPDHDAIDAHITALDCDATRSDHYTKYLDLFQNLMSDYGRSLDSTELRTIGQVISAAPKATDSASYTAWFETYRSAFENAVPNSSSFIDSDERIILEQYHAIAPVTTEGTAYVTWASLFGELVERSVPSSSSFVDDEEKAAIDEVLSVMPVSQSSDAYQAWFPIYTRFFDLAAPSASSVIDSDESTVLQVIKQAKPEASDESSYLSWIPLFRKVFERSAPSVTSFIDSDEQAVIDEVVSIMPDAEGDAAYLAWLPIYTAVYEPALGGSMFLDADERKLLEVIKVVRPLARDGEGYLGWLDVFEQILDRTGSSIDSDEQSALSELLSIQPCGTSEEAVTAFDELDSGALGSEAEQFVQDADPSSCE